MMAGKALQKQTSQAPKDLELRFYWNIRGNFRDHEKGRLFFGLRGWNQIDKRFRSKSSSTGPSASPQSAGTPDGCPGFHHGKKDAHTNGERRSGEKDLDLPASPPLPAIAT
jgi:hypothetical protein